VSPQFPQGKNNHPDVDDDDLAEALTERDWAQDCLQRTHIALGGDGEWTGKLPPEMPPDSGDLHYDVPALAAERMAEIGRLQCDLRLAVTARDYANDMLDKARAELAHKDAYYAQFDLIPKAASHD